MAVARRRILSLHAWFMNRDFGMGELEIMSRASACVMESPTRPATLLSSLHVVQPWRYPHYWRTKPGTEWVMDVREEMVRCSVQVNDADGTKLDEEWLSSEDIMVHPKRDLVGLKFEDEGNGRAFLERHGIALHSEAAGNIRSPELGEEVDCIGHMHTPEMCDGQDVAKPVPCEERGLVAYMDKVHQMGQGGKPVQVDQVFVHTLAPLQMGMCGGPVMDAQGRLAGVIEGSLQIPGKGDEDCFLAAVISADQLLAFIGLPSK